MYKIVAKRLVPTADPYKQRVDSAVVGYKEDVQDAMDVRNKFLATGAYDEVVVKWVKEVEGSI